MVYRKRRRSRRYKKRKRSQKSGRKSLGFKMKQMAAKQDNGYRRYMNEERKDAVETSTNLIHFEVISSLGSYTDVSAMLTASDTGLRLTDLGDTSNYDYTAESTVGKYDLTNYKETVHFRNIDEHPLFLTVYEVVAKKRNPLVNTNVCYDLMQDIIEGWKDRLNTGTTSTTGQTGLNIISASGTTSADVYSNYLNPKNSKQFNSNWRCVKTKKFKLNPGDDVFWKMRLRNRVWNNRNMYLEDDSTRLETVPGYTKCLLVKVHGVIGRSNVADAGDVIGYMKTDLSYDKLTVCKILPMKEQEDDMKYRNVAHDDMTGITLVGPSDVIHTDDGN